MPTLFQSLPFVWSLILIATAITLVGLILFWTEKSLNSPQLKKRASLILRVGFSIYLALVYLLAETGWFTGKTNGLPNIALVLILGVLIFFVPFLFKKDRELLLTLPWALPVLAQVFRIPQEIVLWQYQTEKAIPAELTFLGGNFDVHIGATALFIGVALYSDFKYARPIAIGWNILGIFVSALTIGNGIAYAIQAVPPYPQGNVLAFFPLIWLPAFLWPVALWFHFISLFQLVSPKLQPVANPKLKLTKRIK